MIDFCWNCEQERKGNDISIDGSKCLVCFYPFTDSAAKWAEYSITGLNHDGSIMNKTVRGNDELKEFMNDAIIKRGIIVELITVVYPQ